MSKYWKIVEAGDYTVYSAKLLDLFNNHRSYFNNINSFWNPVKQNYTREVIEQIPEFAIVESLYGQINELAILILNSDSSTLHIDHTIGPNANVKARLNVPVLNCEDSITAFFDLNDATYKMGFLNPGGTLSWSEKLRRTLVPSTKVSLLQPTILKTSQPHTVFCTGKKFPRISLTMSFKEDIVKYLD